MSRGEPIVVACAADRRYACPLAVMLRSVEASLGPDRTVVAHVLDGGLPDADRRRVESSLRTGRVAIRWAKPERSRFVGLPLWGRMPIATYDKLLVSELLPGDAVKALWLDCDLIALADVGSLWDLPFGPHAALAVTDTLVPTVSSRFGVARYREAGLDPRAAYFNAGVMLLDLERWRRDDVAGRALTYLKTHRDDVTFWDQEGLNAVLSGAWGELDPRWNRSATADLMTGESREAWILHFTGGLKPWRYRGPGRSHSLFFRFLDETAWAGWRPPRTLGGATLALYESSRLRRLVYPLEAWWMAVQRTVTRRPALEADVRVPPGDP